jgi:4a-hydroxytetrahydrobiopterin dehydratase
MAQLLTQNEIQTYLSQLPQWKLAGNTIQCLRTFNNFIEAIDFVNKLVDPAEKACHHPDLAVSYNKVTINLTTHDSGGLTIKDFDLAKIISEIN